MTWGWEKAWGAHQEEQHVAGQCDTRAEVS